MECPVLPLIREKLRIARRQGKNHKFSDAEAEQIDAVLKQRHQGNEECTCGHITECRRGYNTLVGYLPLPIIPTFDSNSATDCPTGTLHSVDVKLRTPTIREMI